MKSDKIDHVSVIVADVERQNTELFRELGGYTGCPVFYYFAASTATEPGKVYAVLEGREQPEGTELVTAEAYRWNLEPARFREWLRQRLNRLPILPFV